MKTTTISAMLNLFSPTSRPRSLELGFLRCRVHTNMTANTAMRIICSRGVIWENVLPSGENVPSGKKERRGE